MEDYAWWWSLPLWWPRSATYFTSKSCQPCTVSQIVGRTSRAYELHFLYHHDGNTIARTFHPWLHGNSCKIVQSSFQHRFSVNTHIVWWIITASVRKYTHPNSKVNVDTVQGSMSTFWQIDQRVFEYKLSMKVKNPIFWDIMLCSPLKVNQHFRETCCLHIQGWRSQTRNQYEAGRKQNSG
jgi:hypothetical protein